MIAYVGHRSGRREKGEERKVGKREERWRGEEEVVTRVSLEMGGAG